MLVVLLAVPQLQKNQRNEARKAIASRIVTEINNYAGNNNGKYPIANKTSGDSNFATPKASKGFFTRYLGCETSGSVTTCSANINDPSSGKPMGVIPTVVTAGSGLLNSVAGSIRYNTGQVCDGESATGGNARNFVFQVQLEGGAVWCLDNK